MFQFHYFHSISTIYQHLGEFLRQILSSDAEREAALAEAARRQATFQEER
jgi:hypothetical protein